MDVKMSSIFQIMFLKMILKFVVTKIAKDDLWVRNCKSFLRRKAKKSLNYESLSFVSQSNIRLHS